MLTLSRPYKSYFLAVFSCLVLAGCASANDEKGKIYEAGMVINDPFEDQNRRVMAFNKVVDDAVIHPVVRGYRTVAPKPVRNGIRNFLQNLRTPVTLANQVLQGDIDGAGDVVVRGVVNTLLGVGGIFDIAGYEGIEYEPEDFGQTLAVWGIDHGPYMVVPFIGPSSARDYMGYFADSYADPLRWYLFNVDEELLYAGKFSMEYIDLRESLMDTLTELEKSSIDYYAAVRSTYYQHREALVHDNDNGRKTQTSLPDIPYYEDEE